jgi:hypothetical protein
MRQDNVVASGRTTTRSTLLSNLRTHLIGTPRRAAAFGLAAAIGTGSLMLSTTHTQATHAELAKAATVTNAVDTQSLHHRSDLTKSSVTRAADRAATPAKTVKTAPVTVKPVAGLDATQMHNAALIVKAGQDLGVPQRGQIVAVATAMQESKLYNLASYVVPESLNYHHEGTGADFDSVGLFQQRYTTGWGSVKTIMNPTESAKSFYKALLQVHGWQNMPITVAAQTVQGSAFPDAYAQHTANATTVVNAINAAH